MDDPPQKNNESKTDLKRHKFDTRVKRKDEQRQYDRDHPQPPFWQRLPLIGPVLGMFFGGIYNVIWLAGMVWAACKWVIIAVLIAVLICGLLFGVKMLHWLAGTIRWLWQSLTGKTDGTR